MDFFILWLKVSGAVFVILIVVWFLKIDAEEKKKHKLKADSRPQTRVELSMETTEAPDYPYNIKGINYADIDDTFLGDFFGYVRALKSNRHDPHAIGVYVKNRRVGFLPKGDAQLHARIMALGGSVGAEGYIAKGTGDDGHVFYYGKLDIIWP